MVKIFWIAAIVTSILAAQAFGESKNSVTNIVEKDDPVTAKIKSFICPKTYLRNKNFIKTIFSPKSAYYKDDKVDSLKVIGTLKRNGLLDLFFKEPQEIRLNFTTNGSPIFFVKIMSDTLSSLGYYKYVTVASTMDNAEFTWNITLTAEYATDPLILQEELKKKLCKIVDIKRTNAKEWSYFIDISHAKLNVEKLRNGRVFKLKRILDEQWLDVSKIQKVIVESNGRNHWYPYVAYYDASLHLLKVLKKDKVHHKLSLKIPKNAVYMKLSDLFTLKNIKDEMVFYPKGSR